jgi:hypothetical protein
MSKIEAAVAASKDFVRTGFAHLVLPWSKATSYKDVYKRTDGRDKDLPFDNLYVAKDFSQVEGEKSPEGPMLWVAASVNGPVIQQFTDAELKGELKRRKNAAG